MTTLGAGACSGDPESSKTGTTSPGFVCAADADCPDLDGDPCTGTPYCDKSGGKGTCKTNPATVVQCASDADTACVKNQCDKAFGGCKLKPVADKTPCDDGNPDTADYCVAGKGCVAQESRPAGCQRGTIEGLSRGGGGVCLAGKCVQP